MRVRVTFSKTDHMRYTSHLDVHRTWERTLRRAKMPLSYSQGFNKRPKINLAAALPLGFTSDCEMIEFWLNSHINIVEIKAKLLYSIPPGIKLQTITEIDLNSTKIPNLVDSADYNIILLDPTPNLYERVTKLLAAEIIPRERRNKTYDLRPLIEDIKVAKLSDGETTIQMRLKLKTSATGRPEEVLLSLEIDPFSARVHRTAINLISDC